MIEYLKQIDNELFLFLNGLNSELFDFIMWEVSAKWFWVPVIITFLFLIIKDYRYKSWLPILFFIICFTLTDQGSYQFKHYFERLRPSHNEELAGLVHHVNYYRGGLYGFFSAHAANSFGLFMITSLLLKRKTYTYIVLFWAIIVSYSRIYLGVHYPGDTIAGIIWGLAAGYLLYKLFKVTRKIFNQN